MDGNQSEVGTRQVSTRLERGKKVLKVKKEKLRRPLRRSVRLEEIRRKELVFGGKKKEQERRSPRCDIVPKETPQNASHRKRKRSQDIEAPPEPNPAEKHSKRARLSATAPSIERNSKSGPASTTNEKARNPIRYWSRHGRWPEEYFEPDDQARKYLNKDLEAESWFEKYWQPNMSHLLARKRSASALTRKSSDASSGAPSSITPSDEKQREVKSAPYRGQRYEILLNKKGSFMDESRLGITDASKGTCKDLLDREQSTPRDSLFRDDLFESTFRKMRSRNETRVIRDISLLIVPSAEILATYGADALDCLIESVNEGWNDSIPVTKPRPQPDYAVGFRREAFTEDQLNRLQPFVGDVTDSLNESYFMTTYYMYFPFLACEVKCGAAALDIADRQNAHSMTIAVRAVVELFRYVKREKELDREILAFSISHDHRSVRIYGYYAVIDGPEPRYYRHPIHEFSFTALDGKEKWTAYKFTKNVYDTWMPKHFQRICSAIDAFPRDVNFDVSQQSELQFTEGSGLSQDLGAYSIAQSSAASGSAQAEGDSSIVDNPKVTPNTSVAEEGPFKKPRNERGRGGRK